MNAFHGAHEFFAQHVLSQLRSWHVFGWKWSRMSPGRRSQPPLRLGFLPLTDAAALIAAQVRGDFVHEGIEVVLQREVGWATVREKIIYGELDAAAVPAPMLWSTCLGLDCAPTPVLTGLVFNRHGNALTLATRLRSHGAADAAMLGREARRRRGENRLTFGVVCRYSSHHLHLRQWLGVMGIDPERDVRIVVVPPAQMVRNLADGAIHGFWAGEPWGTVAIRAGLGWSPIWSARHSPGHVEKVLIVTEKFAATRTAEHLALIAALTRASAWCDSPEHHAELARVLSAEPYLNVPERMIRPALEGWFDSGGGRIERDPDFLVLHRNGANLPRVSDARRLQQELIAAGILPARTDPALAATLFREYLTGDAGAKTVEPAPVLATL